MGKRDGLYSTCQVRINGEVNNAVVDIRPTPRPGDGHVTRSPPAHSLLPVRCRVN